MSKRPDAKGMIITLMWMIGTVLKLAGKAFSGEVAMFAAIRNLFGMVGVWIAIFLGHWDARRERKKQTHD